MPQMLQPGAANYVAVPSAAQPVQPKQPTGQVAPQAPVNPFQVEPGPPILVLPHEPTEEEGPQRQQRGRPVRMGHTEVALTDAIRAATLRANPDPEDMTPRLVLADHLRDIGSHAMGEVVHRGAIAPHRHGWYQVEDGVDGVNGKRLTHHAILRHPGDMESHVNIWSDPATGQAKGGLIFVRPRELPGDMVGAANLATTDLDLLRRVLEDGQPSQEYMTPHRERALHHVIQSMGATPERFAAKAPAGGFITRGINSRGGEFLPKEAYEARPMPTQASAPPKRSMKERLHAALKKNRGAVKATREGRPVRMSAEPGPLASYEKGPGYPTVTPTRWRVRDITNQSIHNVGLRTGIKAVLFGEPQIEVWHGGSVAGAYRYPAETGAAVVVGLPSGHVIFHRRQAARSAKGVTAAAAAGAVWPSAYMFAHKGASAASKEESLRNTVREAEGHIGDINHLMTVHVHPGIHPETAHHDFKALYAALRHPESDDTAKAVLKDWLIDQGHQGSDRLEMPPHGLIEALFRTAEETRK